ncbi:MAG: hypothetical protein AB7E96_07415 [Deferribacterales bacterium]
MIKRKVPINTKRFKAICFRSKNIRKKLFQINNSTLITLFSTIISGTIAIYAIYTTITQSDKSLKSVSLRNINHAIIEYRQAAVEIENENFFNWLFDITEYDENLKQFMQINNKKKSTDVILNELAYLISDPFLDTNFAKSIETFIRYEKIGLEYQTKLKDCLKSIYKHDPTNIYNALKRLDSFSEHELQHVTIPIKTEAYLKAYVANNIRVMKQVDKLKKNVHEYAMENKTTIIDDKNPDYINNLLDLGVLKIYADTCEESVKKY